ncbi:aspartate 1-decarboxylase [archaeon]|nr:aspartate 1-decarboxylase [archaeon]
MREYLHAKIHRAIITETNLNYIGSITIDENLLDKTRLKENQKVLVADLTNGARLETYIIKGKRNSGMICMNGPTAHIIKIGDIVIIMGFEITKKPKPPKIILVDSKNRFVKYIKK